MQERTYAWTPPAFTQVAGPTSFQADDTIKLTVTAPDGQWSAPVNGVSRSTLRITVRNDGGTPVGSLVVVLNLGVYVSGAGGDRARCNRTSPTGQQPFDPECPIGTIAVGGEASLMLPLTVDYDGLTMMQPKPTGSTIGISVRPGDQRYSDTSATIALA